MANLIKLKGYTRQYRIAIEKEKELNDAEVRLYYIYVRIADWDKRHKETFGSTNTTLRDIQRDCLPRWCLGKLSYTSRNLIKKGWLVKRPDKRIEVRNYGIYREKSVQVAERMLQLDKQSVQSSEQDVH